MATGGRASSRADEGATSAQPEPGNRDARRARPARRPLAAHRRRWLFGLTLLLVVAAAACGGGSDDERSADTASAGSQAEDGDAPADDEASDSAEAACGPGGAGADDADASDGGSASGGSSSAPTTEPGGTQATDPPEVEIGEGGISVGGDGEGGGISVGEDGVSVGSGEGQVSVDDEGVTVESGEGQVAVGEGGVSIESCFGDIEVEAEGGDITVSGPDGDVSISVGDAVTELGGEDTDAGISVPLPDSVLFDFDSAALRPEAGEELSLLAGLAAAYPDATIEIGGHTDSVGDDAYNQQLSDQRAAAVRDALGVLGVAGDRMTATGYGETRPVAPNATPDGADDPAGRQRNRRVEILLVGADL